MIDPQTFDIPCELWIKPYEPIPEPIQHREATEEARAACKAGASRPEKA
jgi:hypothetical protein